MPTPHLSLFRRITSGLRCLPDFVVIGAHSSGTTSFYANLVRHPEIRAASAKELHFFNSSFGNFERREAWYRGHFPLRGRGWQRRSITGEATPAYLFQEGVAARVAAMLPNARFIVLLRNPVRRAHSHYHKKLRKGTVAVPFERIVRSQLDELRGATVDVRCLDRTLAARRARSHSPPADGGPAEEDHLPLLVLRGVYVAQLEAWLARFPRERFLIVKSEDYFADPLRVIGEVGTAFLGAAPWQPGTYKRRNQGHRYPPLNPALRDELADFYRPYNERLYELVDRDFGWEAELLR